MEDTLLILNNSKKLEKIDLVTAIAHISMIRDVKIDVARSGEFIDNVIDRSYEPKRKQVKLNNFLCELNKKRDIHNYQNEGKLILFDEDLYSSIATNFCFGGYLSAKKGLGFIVLSMARIYDSSHAQFIIRHELGHMFGAPREGRSNTESSLGNHCINDLCTMQQKLNVIDSANYSRLLKKSNTYPFCGQCADDIINYKPIYR